MELLKLHYPKQNNNNTTLRSVHYIDRKYFEQDKRTKEYLNSKYLVLVHRSSNYDGCRVVNENDKSLLFSLSNQKLIWIEKSELKLINGENNIVYIEIDKNYKLTFIK